MKAWTTSLKSHNTVFLNTKKNPTNNEAGPTPLPIVNNLSSLLWLDVDSFNPDRFIGSDGRFKNTYWVRFYFWQWTTYLIVLRNRIVLKSLQWSRWINWNVHWIKILFCKEKSYRYINTYIIQKHILLLFFTSVGYSLITH